MHGVDTEGTGGPFLQERVTKAFPVITTDHGFIHEGIAYTLAGSVTVDGAWSLAITTPADQYTHFKPTSIAVSGGPVVVSFTEGDTFEGGSAATPRNRNRTLTSPDSSTVVCKTGVTPGGAGTTLFTSVIPGITTGSTRIGAGSSAAEEFVLKPSTVYILTLTESAVGTVLCGYDLFWYEEESA